MLKTTNDMQSNEKKYELPNDFINNLGNSKEIYQKIGNIKNNVVDEQKANDFMREKSYSQDNKAIKNMAVMGGFLTSSFSIASGLYFLYSTFVLILWFDVLSWIIASIVLVVIETLKHISTQKTFELFYRGRNVVAYVIFVLILVGLSVLFSIKGVESFYSNVMHEKPLLIDTKKISNDYESRIKDIEKQRAAFTNSVSWQGQINIYDPQIRSSLSNFDTQIAKIRDEKTKNIQKLENQNKSTQQKNDNKHLTSVFYLILIFGMNELFCLLSLWFPAHYNYRVDKESKYRDLLQSTSKETKIYIPSPQKIEFKNPNLKMNTTQENVIIPNELKGKNDFPINSIGFQCNAGTDAGTDNKNTEIIAGTDAGTDNKNTEIIAGTDASDAGTDANLKNFVPKYEVLLNCVQEYEETKTIDGRVKKGLNPELRVLYLNYIETNGLDFCKERLVVMRTDMQKTLRKENRNELTQNQIF